MYIYPYVCIYTYIYPSSVNMWEKLDTDNKETSIYCL